jgi:O-antigen/teichoic acid export membrane protein
MGVIVRQSIKSSIVNYVSMALGIVNTFFIYTLCFDESQIGFFRWLMDVSLLLSGILSLGITRVNIRYFPLFKTEGGNGHHGMLSIVLLVVSLSFTIFAISFLLLKSFLPTNYSENSIFLLATIFATLMSDSLFSFITNFGRIVVPTIFRNFWLKLAMGLVAIIFYYWKISFNAAVYLWLIFYYVNFLAQLSYVAYLGEFKFTWHPKFYRKKLIKSMSVYAGFGVLGIISSGMATKLDTIMISEILQFDRTGVYSIAINAVALLTTTSVALYAISAPILSASIKSNDWGNVESIYKKAGNNLLILGLFILLLIWINIEDIFEIIPNGQKYVDGKYVILILGVAQLFEMSTSVNDGIIQYSKYFKFNLYVLLMLAIINIIANLLLIPVFNILGAAMATGISLMIYNSAKTLFIYRKFKIHPFQWSMLKIVFISFLLTFMFSFDFSSNPFYNVIFKSVLASGIFIFLVICLKLSTDVNSLFLKYSRMVLAKIKKN